MSADLAKSKYIQAKSSVLERESLNELKHSTAHQQLRSFLGSSSKLFLEEKTIQEPEARFSGRSTLTKKFSVELLESGNIKVCYTINNSVDANKLWLGKKNQTTSFTAEVPPQGQISGEKLVSVQPRGANPSLDHQLSEKRCEHLVKKTLAAFIKHTPSKKT